MDAAGADGGDDAVSAPRDENCDDDEEHRSTQKRNGLRRRPRETSRGAEGDDRDASSVSSPRPCSGGWRVSVITCHQNRPPR